MILDLKTRFGTRKMVEAIAKYRLDDLLTYQYISGSSKEPTQLESVYAIVYRILCIPEGKSYVGQTYSHYRNQKYITKRGVLGRIKDHYRQKDDERLSKHPLYVALRSYPASDFVVYEEIRLHGSDIAGIADAESELIESYMCCTPSGYNIQVGGGNNCGMLRELANLYGFDVPCEVADDTTRFRRVKDVMFGKYFGVPRGKATAELILEKLATVNMTCAKATRYGKDFRVVVRLWDEPINIRITLTKTGKSEEELTEECIGLASSLDTVVTIDPSLQPDLYKYSAKVEKVLEHSNTIRTVTGHMYTYKARGFDAYMTSFYGEKSKLLVKVCFGGKTTPLEESYADAQDFVARLLPNLPNANRVNIKSIYLSETGGCHRS